MKGYAKLTVVFVLYCLCCIAMAAADGGWLYIVMPWNVFLAAVPLFCITRAKRALDGGHRLGAGLLLLLWLLFYPNAVYMATDFIHISGAEFFTVTGGSGSLTPRRVYSTDILLWCRLLVIAAGFLMSMLMGLESMRLAARMAERRLGPGWHAPFAAVTALLGGLGVYIGRFLRFNSWDVLRPVTLIRRVLGSLDGFAAVFIVCYGGFILLAYLFYHLLVSAGRNTD